MLNIKRRLNDIIPIAKNLPEANEDEAECYWQLIRKFRGQIFNKEMSDKALSWIRST
jgi:hypothetical protein